MAIKSRSEILKMKHPNRVRKMSVADRMVLKGYANVKKGSGHTNFMDVVRDYLPDQVRQQYIWKAKSICEDA